MSEVKAQRVTDYDVLESERKPGMFMYTTRKDVEGHAGILFVCPCGCGEISGVNIKLRDGHHDAKVWDWDGNEDEPTIRPSLLKVGGPSDCRYHGFLTAGVFRSC